MSDIQEPNHSDPASSEEKFLFISNYEGFDLRHQKEIADWLTNIAQSKARSINSIEYVFCNDEYVLDLNKTHLDHDYLTDILTFPLQNSPIEANIFISMDRVKENALTYKVEFEDELHRVMAHGLLHLLGYNDHGQDEKKQMRIEEDLCLALRDFI